MTRIAYLDCFAGISGDMFVGALLDLGLEMADLERELSKIDLTGYRLAHTSVDKLGLRATHFKVLLDSADDTRLADGTPPDHTHTHNDHHRAFTHIRDLIARSALSDTVKATATRIFTRLAEAEAAVHGVEIDQVHFHELGAVDAIVDIVSAAIGIELLAIGEIVCSPLHLGSGFVRMAHGLYPIPAPATARLIAGAPVYSTEAKGELVTPTGAAIATTLARGYGPLPAMTVTRTGYGAGTRDREFPNVLRVMLGERGAMAAATAPRTPFPEQHVAATTSAGYHEGPATVIEANIDDMNPQLYDTLIERLLAAGALDVVLIPAHMKKNRPGIVLQVLAHPASVDPLLAIVFAESTTIGARTYDVTKRMLQRESITVTTPYGALRVKVARLGGRVVNAAPEFEDCRALAASGGVAVKAVHAAAQSAAWAELGGGL